MAFNLPSGVINTPKRFKYTAKLLKNILWLIWYILSDAIILLYLNSLLSRNFLNCPDIIYS